MKTLYETPNGEYRIVSFTYDGWKDVFSDLDGYYLFKKVQPVKDASAEEKEKDETAGKVFRQEDSVKGCLLWLKKNRIISKDEFDYQVKNLCPRETLGEN